MEQLLVECRYTQIFGLCNSAQENNAISQSGYLGWCPNALDADKRH
jgi:hypothetical protein